MPQSAPKLLNAADRQIHRYAVEDSIRLRNFHSWKSSLRRRARSWRQSRTAVEAFKAATGINSLEEERTLLLHQQSDAQESLTQAMSKQQDAQGRYQKTRAAAEDHAQRHQAVGSERPVQGGRRCAPARGRPSRPAEAEERQLSRRQHDDEDFERSARFRATAARSRLPGIGGPGRHGRQSRAATGRNRSHDRGRRSVRRDRQPGLLRGRAGAHRPKS